MILKGLLSALLAICAFNTSAWRSNLNKELFKKAFASQWASSQAVPFDGSYADPNHPNCKRSIAVSGSVAIVTGTDGTPGCPPDGSGTPWKLYGKVQGPFIVVDFSPKGGPDSLQGVYDTSTPEGIKWPDGNKWVKV